MKSVLLICPDQRPALEPLTGGVPLALAIFLGKPLIEHALDGLAGMEVTRVRLLASDRPSEVRAYVMSGTQWGLEVDVLPEASELSSSSAMEKHRSFAADMVLTLDALPQAPEVKILTDVASWHSARLLLLPRLVRNQIGAKEILPNIWLGLKAKVDPTASLVAPCWIGPNSIVRSHAVVGPNAFIESDSLIDSSATVEESTISSRTYLGSLTHLSSSIASGSYLTNWRSGSNTHLNDAFLLAPLDPPTEAASSPIGRILALLFLILTIPILGFAQIIAWLTKRPLFQQHLAVLPSDAGVPQRTITWYSLNTVGGLLRRWPMLWRIVTGHFAWIGNPPLSPNEAATLEGEFERLWVQIAPGFFTAPEAEGSSSPWDDAAKAHAALYACQPTTAWRGKIVRHGLSHLFPQTN